MARPAHAEDVTASILALATTTPAHVLEQSLFADFYFRATGSEHMTGLKQKLEKICENSGIQRRHTALTEEYLKANPAMCEIGGKSLDARQKLACAEIPKLAKAAAEKAVKAWGQPLSRVTHLLFVTGSSVDMPGADVVVANMLGLNPGVKRLMFYMQGCTGGVALLSVAKSVAESNPGSRLLLICGDLGTVATFRGPQGPLDTSTLIGQSFAADGFAALVVGTSPSAEEVPLFRIRDSLSYLIPQTENLAHGRLSEAGVTLCFSRDFPLMVATTISQLLSASPELKRCLSHSPAGNQPITSDILNSCFWAIHAGGRHTLDLLQEKLGLTPAKMKSSRDVLAEHGNMGAATALFALERVLHNGASDSLGLVVGYGLGITVEIAILEAAKR